MNSSARSGGTNRPIGNHRQESKFCAAGTARLPLWAKCPGLTPLTTQCDQHRSPPSWNAPMVACVPDPKKPGQSRCIAVRVRGYSHPCRTILATAAGYLREPLRREFSSRIRFSRRPRSSTLVGTRLERRVLPRVSVARPLGSALDFWSAPLSSMRMCDLCLVQYYTPWCVLPLWRPLTLHRPDEPLTQRSALVADLAWATQAM